MRRKTKQNRKIRAHLQEHRFKRKNESEKLTKRQIFFNECSESSKWYIHCLTNSLLLLRKILSAQSHGVEKLCTVFTASQLGYSFCCLSHHCTKLYQGLFSSPSRETFQCQRALWLLQCFHSTEVASVAN